MDRRSGKQRRKPTRFLKNSDNVGRRIDDLEFSLFLKMGIFTGIVLISCIIAAMFIA